MKKVIYCASTFSHINNFHMPYIKQLVEDNVEVIVVAGGESMELPYVKKCINLPIKKKILSLQNIVASYKFRRILKKECVDIIYMHTTLAACIARVSLTAYKNRPYVINMVHGYLFGDKSKPLKKNIYLGVEKILRRYTDSIVVMNDEDLKIVSENKLALDDIQYVKGVGIDKDKFFSQSTKGLTRDSMNIKSTDKVMIFVGELSKRKNQTKLIEVMKYLPDDYHLILVGTGELERECKQIIYEYKVEKRVHMVGYQTNTMEYYMLSDICISLSEGEGLPFNIVEAMLCRLPVIASRIKGHKELVGAKWLIDNDNALTIAQFIMTKSDEEFKQASDDNLETANQYTLDNVFDDNYNFLRGKL